MNRWDNINSDYILKEYNYDKQKIINMLDHPQELIKHMWHDLISIDHSCRFKMKKGHLDTEFICINCQNMNIIMSEPNKPFKLHDSTYIVSETQVTKPFLNLNKNIKGDPFTMKILLTWYIETVFNKLNIPAIKLETGFICGNHGYLLYKAPVINNQLCNIDCLLDTVDKKILIENSYGLLCQFIVIYDVLKDIKFNLGHSNKYSFLMDDKPCSYIYKNKTIECKYTVYLADLSYSSVKINNVQYSVDQLIFNNDKTYERKENQYRIKDFVKHNLPLSIDFYLLLSSLVEEDFIEIIKASPEAYELWKKLWVNHDDIKVDEDREYNEMLQNIWLYDNPTEFLFL